MQIFSQIHLNGISCCPLLGTRKLDAVLKFKGSGCDFTWLDRRPRVLQPPPTLRMQGDSPCPRNSSCTGWRAPSRTRRHSSNASVWVSVDTLGRTWAHGSLNTGYKPRACSYRQSDMGGRGRSSRRDTWRPQWTEFLSSLCWKITNIYIIILCCSYYTDHWCVQLCLIRLKCTDACQNSTYIFLSPWKHLVKARNILSSGGWTLTLVTGDLWVWLCTNCKRWEEMRVLCPQSFPAAPIQNSGFSAQK